MNMEPNEYMGGLFDSLAKDWKHLQKSYQGSFLKKALSSAQDAAGLSSLSQLDPSKYLNQAADMVIAQEPKPVIPIGKKKSSMLPLILIGGGAVVLFLVMKK
jgi:hypothetical protein